MDLLRAQTRPSDVSPGRPPPTGLARSARGRLDALAFPERGHAEVAQAVSAALAGLGVAPGEMQAEAQLSAYGARMALAVRLPRAYDFDPGDGHALALRLVGLHAADGAWKPRLLLGWYRYVSASTLPVGTTGADWRLAYREALAANEVRALLAEGLAQAERERVALQVWSTLAVPHARFVRFADGALTAAWGAKAAARFLHLATTGFDGELAAVAEPVPAHARTVRRTRRVPGAPGHATSAYDAAQALAWVAKGRREWEERVEGELQIPELMHAMLAR